MTPTQLRETLVDVLGDYKTAERAADALHCTRRSVYKWLAGERQIPGPVIAALELARVCPKELLPALWKEQPAGHPAIEARSVRIADA